MLCVSNILKPEYSRRPSQVLRRIRLALSWPQQPFVTVRLPWNLPLRCRPNEHIGKTLLHYGVYDLAVTECLWRLIDSDDFVVDVGTNIGYMSSIMFRRAARIRMFEAHPAIFEELCSNLEAWRHTIPDVVSCATQQAVSDHEGTIYLHVPVAFSANRGLASVATNALVNANDRLSETMSCEAVSLDSVIGNEPIGVLKVDVEGHELEVLKGSQRLLSSQLIRDCVFEDGDPSCSRVAQLFAGHGYTVFRMVKRWGGLALTPLKKAGNTADGTPSLLATIAPERAMKLFACGGWKSLHGISYR